MEVISYASTRGLGLDLALSYASLISTSRRPSESLIAQHLPRPDLVEQGSQHVYWQQPPPDYGLEGTVRAVAAPGVQPASQLQVSVLYPKVVGVPRDHKLELLDIANASERYRSVPLVRSKAVTVNSGWDNPLDGGMLLLQKSVRSTWTLTRCWLRRRVAPLASLT